MIGNRNYLWAAIINMLKELKKPGLKKKEDIMTASPQIKNINKEIVFFLKKRGNI